MYKTAAYRMNRTFPLWGLPKGDLDTANGQDRQQYRRAFEGKERFRFLKQQRG